MKSYFFLIVAFALLVAGCNTSNKNNSREEAYGETKLLLTNYNNDFELYAETDPFVVGKTATLITHFTHLSDFKALEEGAVSVRLDVKGVEIQHTLEKPTAKGIYIFNLKPETGGIGSLIFDVVTDQGNSQLIISEVEVFSDENEAIFSTKEKMHFPTTATSFTKEQSWKVDFATDHPQVEPFGQVIKTTAQVLPAPNDEAVVSANSNGIVLFSPDHLLEGSKVLSGQVLYSISSSGLASSNASIQFLEAQNNYVKSKSDYERMSELVKDKIVSERELLNAKNQYKNAKAVYDNYSKNFSASGQKIVSPMDGYIQQVLVRNGQSVEAGQPIVVVAQNRTLMLRADVQQKYAPVLSALNSATIRSMHDNYAYTLEELNGKILSFGRSASHENYLIPISLQIENNGAFVSGGFVEIYLKIMTDAETLTIPNSALLEEQGNYFVFVQIHPELFEKREVKIGATDGLRTEIIKGVEPQNRIVTVGAIMVKLAEATSDLDAHSGHMH